MQLILDIPVLNPAVFARSNSGVFDKHRTEPSAKAAYSPEVFSLLKMKTKLGRVALIFTSLVSGEKIGWQPDLVGSGEFALQ